SVLHLPPQGLHLGDVEAGIMSHHDDAGAFEDTVERRDELLLSRSIHCKLFPVGGPSSVPEPPVATCRPSLALPYTRFGACRAGRRSEIPAHQAQRWPHRVLSRFEPVAGLSAPKRVFPRLCRHLALSQDLGSNDLGSNQVPAPAVSDRTDFRKLPEGLGATRKTSTVLGPLQIDPTGCPKGKKS